MTVHLRPETEAKLAAHVASIGMSIDDYLEELVEKELPEDTDDVENPDAGQFYQKHGIWVYRTGKPMPASMIQNTIEEIRREREESFLPER